MITDTKKSLAKMKCLVIILSAFIQHAVSHQCPVSNIGHFYRNINLDGGEENNGRDEPILGPEFFDCGVKDSCTHVVKFKDTNTYELVHGEAELKSIKRPIIVWEKQVEKNPEEQWIVIQRRVDASINFTRSWAEYQSGFGDPSGNFWIGLDKLHCLAGPGKGAILNITMKHGSNPCKLFYAAYTLFEIGNEAGGYRLIIGGYSGNANDSMASHNEMRFSTYDRDNDLSPDNCASKNRGGWWYNACSKANLNNLYPVDSQTKAIYMSWYYLHMSYGNIIKPEMKIQVTERSDNC